MALDEEFRDVEEDATSPNADEDEAEVGADAGTLLVPDPRMTDEDAVAFDDDDKSCLVEPAMELADDDNELLSSEPVAGGAEGGVESSSSASIF